MKAKDFDQKFEAGEDITPYLDLSKAQRLGTNSQRICIELPVAMLVLIHQEARRLGVTPQTVIQTSLAEHLAHSQPQ